MADTHFKPGETVYCRFTGQAFIVDHCDGAVAGLRWEGSDETSTRIVGELTRLHPDRSLNESLALIGVTHSADERETASHRLYAPDGSFIGWYTAWNACQNFDAIADIANARAAALSAERSA